MGAGPDVEDEGPLEPRDEEMGPLANSLLHHTANPVEDHRPLATVHRVQRGVQRRRGGAKAERRPRNVGQERNRRLIAPHPDANESTRLAVTTDRDRDSSRGCRTRVL